MKRLLAPNAPLVAAATVGCALALVVYGSMARRNQWIPFRIASTRGTAGKPALPVQPWNHRRQPSRGPSSNGASSDALRAFPYAQGYRPAAQSTGVRLLDAEHVAEGINLYTSGDAPEATLIDASGAVLHRWSKPIQEVWPDAGRTEPDATYSKYWRNAALVDDGGVVAIFDYIGLVRVDRDSRLVWASRCGCHHDLQLMPDGSIYALTAARTTRAVQGARIPIVEDFITHLTPTGTVIDSLSLPQAIQRSDYASLWTSADDEGDVLHTNSLQLLPPALAAGFAPAGSRAALVSFSAINTIAVVDLDAGTVVWALSGMFSGQHSVGMLDSGRILLFDNGGNGAAEGSRVIEIDPRTQRVEWRWSGEGAGGLFSERLGEAQRLANGNTLVVESVNGRSIEVAKDGHVVWMFVSPHTAGARNELVASLFHMHRYEASASILRSLTSSSR